MEGIVSSLDEFYNEKNEEKEPYKSSLGDFTYQQELLIRFGSGNKVLFYWILYLISLVMSLLTLIVIWKLDFVTLFAEYDVDLQRYNILIRSIGILSVVLSLILPYAIGRLYLGCKNLNLKSASKGVKVARIFLQVISVLLGIGAIGAVIVTILILIRMPIIGLLIGLLLFGLFIVYFKLMSLLIDLLFLIEMNLTGHNSKLPFHYELKKYAWIVFAILVVTTSISLLQDSSADPAYIALMPQVAALMSQLNLYSVIAQFIGVVIGAYSIYLISAYENEVYSVRNKYE
jgi:hypothetical protein